jgi:hypothetical protein
MNLDTRLEPGPKTELLRLMNRNRVLHPAEVLLGYGYEDQSFRQTGHWFQRFARAVESHFHRLFKHAQGGLEQPHRQ